MTTKVAYIGIDPGVSKTSPGTACLLADIIEFYDWQSKETAAAAITRWTGSYDIKAVSIERVWSRPTFNKRGERKEGHTSKLVENFGFWQGLTWHICRPGLYTPQQWQKIIPGYFRGTTKERSRQAALLFFPQAEKYLKFKKHNGRADALMIAEYGKRIDRIKRGNEAFLKKCGGKS